MLYAYVERKRANSIPANSETATVQPSPDALRAGAAKPTAEQMGHRVDLPDAIRSMRENAFGADLSSVKLYEAKARKHSGLRGKDYGSLAGRENKKDLDYLKKLLGGYGQS